jgi:hypothetical protein
VTLWDLFCGYLDVTYRGVNNQKCMNMNMKEMNMNIKIKMNMVTNMDMDTHRRGNWAWI